MTSQVCDLDQYVVGKIAEAVEAEYQAAYHDRDSSRGAEWIRQTVTASPHWPPFVRLVRAGVVHADFVSPDGLAKVVLGWAGGGRQT
jgi:hypothetical protein